MKKEIKYSTLLTIGNGIVGLLSFIYASLVGRHIGPAKYADFGVALSIYYVAAMTNTPMRNMMTHFTHQYSVRMEFDWIRVLLFSTVRFLIKWLLILSVPLIILSPFISRYLRLDTGPIMLILIFLMEAVALILNCYRGVIGGIEAYITYNWNFILEAAFRLAAGLGLILIFPNAVAGIIAYPLAMVIAIFHARIKISDLPVNTDVSPDYREIRKYLKPLLLSSLFFSILYSLDAILARIYLPSGIAGHYMAATQISKFLYIIAISFNTIVINFTSHEAILQRTALKKLVSTVLYYFTICSAATIVIFLFARPLIHLSFGSQFDQSLALLLPLCGAVVFSGVSLMLCYYALGYGSFHVFTIPAATIFLQGFLIRQMHASALKIAVATFYSQMIMFIFMSIYIIIVHKTFLSRIRQ